MRKTAFILGAGFSAAAQFPLVRGLKELVINFLETERHAIYTVSLEPGPGFERGEFYEGLDQIDENSQRGFEELLIALRHICATADGYDPRHATLRVLRIGCARLLWQRQNAIRKAPVSYENFAKRFFKPAEMRSNLVISFNWDLLIERSLQDVAVPWDYSSGVPGVTAVLKPHGSINWSSWLEGGGSCDYEGWRTTIAPQSKLSFDVTRPFVDPDVDEINPDDRYMLFPGDPELPEENANLKLIWSDVQTALEQSEARRDNWRPSSDHHELGNQRNHPACGLSPGHLSDSLAMTLRLRRRNRHRDRRGNFRVADQMTVVVDRVERPTEN